MRQKIVFAFSHVHSDISEKTKPCHSTIKMEEGTRRCVTVQKQNESEYEESEVGEEYILSDNNGSDNEAEHLHTLILTTGN
jgi:hypothetical protein